MRKSVICLHEGILNYVDKPRPSANQLAVISQGVILRICDSVWKTKWLRYEIQVTLAVFHTYLNTITLFNIDSELTSRRKEICYIWSRTDISFSPFHLAVAQVSESWLWYKRSLGRNPHCTTLWQQFFVLFFVCLFPSSCVHKTLRLSTAHCLEF